MKRNIIGAGCGLFVVFAASALPAQSHSHSHSDHGAPLTVENAWARETAPTAKSGGIYATIVNSGEAPDRLIAASTDIADRTELHTHIKEGDVMRMRPVEGGIEVGPGDSVSLAPGGLHVMLMGLAGPLTEGTTVPLTLTFENAGEIEVDVTVQDIAFEGHGDKHGAHHSHN